MAGATSLLFAATLLPLPVPVVGATSHICLTPVLALIGGGSPHRMANVFVLFIQAIFFAHGGLTALGVNTLHPRFGRTCHYLLHMDAFTKDRFGECDRSGYRLWIWWTERLRHKRPCTVSRLSRCRRADKDVYRTVLIGFSPVQIPLAVLESIVSVGIIRVLATRRPDLLPDSLRILIAGKVSISSISSTMIVLMMVGLAGCNYEGIDGSVFGAASESAGRPPTNTIVDLSQGEFGLAMAIIILFGNGIHRGAKLGND